MMPVRDQLIDTKDLLKLLALADAARAYRIAVDSDDGDVDDSAQEELLERCADLYEQDAAGEDIETSFLPDTLRGWMESSGVLYVLTVADLSGTYEGMADDLEYYDEPLKQLLEQHLKWDGLPAAVRETLIDEARDDVNGDGGPGDWNEAFQDSITEHLAGALAAQQAQDAGDAAE